MMLDTLRRDGELRVLLALVLLALVTVVLGCELRFQSSPAPAARAESESDAGPLWRRVDDGTVGPRTYVTTRPLDIDARRDPVMCISINISNAEAALWCR